MHCEPFRTGADGAAGVASVQPVAPPAIDPLAPTLFHQPWWLDIATRQRYGMIETRHQGRVVGRMPYYLTRRLGYVECTMPTLTDFLGPATDDGEGSANTRFLRRLAITRDLIHQLPQAAYFYQKFHRGVTDTLAFQGEGYESSVQFTHEIAPQPQAAIWAGMRDKTRNMVRKADRVFTCVTEDDPERYTRFYTDNLAGEGRRNLLDERTCQALIAASLARGCGRIYCARQPDGTPAAAIFCAWDQSAFYYLMSTRRPGSGNSTTTLLLWKAICDATSRGLMFDFDGVGTSGAVLFYAGFGAAIRPRYIATKAGKLSTFLMAIRRHLIMEKSKFF